MDLVRAVPKGCRRRVGRAGKITPPMLREGDNTI